MGGDRGAGETEKQRRQRERILVLGNHYVDRVEAQNPAHPIPYYDNHKPNKSKFYYSPPSSQTAAATPA